MRRWGYQKMIMRNLQRDLNVPLGGLPVSSFLNQAFQNYSLPSPNPKPFGGNHEKEFTEGANRKPPREFLFL